MSKCLKADKVTSKKKIPCEIPNEIQLDTRAEPDIIAEACLLNDSTRPHNGHMCQSMSFVPNEEFLEELIFTEAPEVDGVDICSTAIPENDISSDCRSESSNKDMASGPSTFHTRFQESASKGWSWNIIGASKDAFGAPGT